MTDKTVFSDLHKKHLGESRKGKFGGKLTESERSKISDRMKGEKNPMYGMTGENNPNYGKHHSESTRQKISDAGTGEKNPMYGKHHSEESKELMSQKMKESWKRRKALRIANAQNVVIPK